MAEIFNGLPPPGPAQLIPIEQACADYMTMIGRDQRAHRARTLLTYEIADKAARGWFLIFNTLTVAPEHYSKIFGKECTAFRKYITAINKLTRNALGLTKRHDPTEYHTYAAVVEAGTKTGRLHIHVIHCLKALPKKARDPNFARPRPNARELACLKPLWEYGHTCPIMIRYSLTDAFAKAGYRWPLDPNRDAAMQFRSPLATAGYMAKYLAKSYASPKRSKYLWRIRKTHKLGNAILTYLTSQLTSRSLLTVASLNLATCKLNNSSIPPSLLKQACLKRLLSRASQNEKRGLINMGKLMQPNHSPLQSLRVSSRNSQTRSQPNSANIATLGLSEMDISNALRELRAAAKNTNNKYFKETSNTYGTTTTADYLHQ
ncbi:MAG: replication initiator protein [Arizlama microvirus]|nr:MAG: replication initiator protein [Arizlama microvirus]